MPDFGVQHAGGDVRLNVGKDKAIQTPDRRIENNPVCEERAAENQTAEKKAEETGSTLYIARDDSRRSCFTWTSIFWTSCGSPPSELREKTLAFLTR